MSVHFSGVSTMTPAIRFGQQDQKLQQYLASLKLDDTVYLGYSDPKTFKNTAIPGKVSAFPTPQTIRIWTDITPHIVVSKTTGRTTPIEGDYYYVIHPDQLQKA